MQNYEGPEVTVTQIPLPEAGEDPILVDLGERTTSIITSGLMTAMRDRADKAYILTWEGSTRVPRGAQLGNWVIAWTKHGRVIAEDDTQFGVYDRRRDPVSPDQQSEMLVFTFPETDAE